MRLPNKDEGWITATGRARGVPFTFAAANLRYAENSRTQRPEWQVPPASLLPALLWELESWKPQKYYPEFAVEIESKADAAYQEGIKKPGACQTASVLSPYIYEEDNWVDDMELELWSCTRKPRRQASVSGPRIRTS